MRDVLHAAALTVVLFIAACCALVQLGDVESAIDRLGSNQQSVIQPVSSDRGAPGPR